MNKNKLKAWAAEAKAWLRKNWLYGITGALLVLIGVLASIGWVQSHAQQGITLDGKTTVEKLSTAIVGGLDSIVETLKKFNLHLSGLGTKYEDLNGRVDKIEKQPGLNTDELQKKIDEKLREKLKDLGARADNLQLEAARKQPGFMQRPVI